MSSQRGNVKKGAPKYQNTFAYKHNPKSKKTEHILGLPIHGLCPHCHAQIVWRKKYRKYKPLTQPASCTSCHQKTVLAAYHVLCQPCAKVPRPNIFMNSNGMVGKRSVRQMLQVRRTRAQVQLLKSMLTSIDACVVYRSEQQVAEMKEEENKEFEDQLEGLKERERRKVLRQKKKEEEEAAAAAKAARRAALGLDTYDDDDDLDDMEQYLSD
ncbi:hypothetical protein AC1031_008209 [Aphanomyces cochlioides]|nr:hypothetical protein AC1031_008209 [Aphanomyces cochlioides]